MGWGWKSVGSLLATLMFLHSTIITFLPPEAHHLRRRLLARLLSAIRATDTILIKERDSSISTTNELYSAASTRLSSHCLRNAPVICLSKDRNTSALTSSLPDCHSATDSFNGIPLHWRFLIVNDKQPTLRSLELSFDRRHREIVHSLYIPHLLHEAGRLRFESRKRRLFTNDTHWTGGIPFTHPSTFDSLAIDPALRDSIVADLRRFSALGDYYARVGRAWKRGFLLYGPPGTGKTSLIAAIANFLKFDVYDLELTAVTSNSHLRKLLISTTSKSVVVVEDVDCALDLSDRKNKTKKAKTKKVSTTKPTVSLSGVLNFVDGLWSSCVGERLMVFTTNHPERLDPALLRPGRMDMQIELSYCEAPAFRVLARNYLDVGEGHPLMGEAEALLGEVKMTPAEVAEVFMSCENNGADAGMQMAVEEMRRRTRL